MHQSNCNEITMRVEKAIPKNIEEHISGFSPEIQKMLKELRATIRNAAPQAEEKISNQMPSYVQKGILVYFAAFKNHIGFYPTSTGIEKFKKELSIYKGGKGSVQFSINNPLPLSLITRIVKFRVKENMERAIQKQKRKKS
jgi:uncharacterized protein YdhG (YjbR/CyaY superfamily)